MATPDPLPTRERRLEEAASAQTDVVVVGGGITGAGIALDLALRGVRCTVLERGDWAGATSSASSRLIHGGLRYLEQYEFGLVRDSCIERARLLDNAAGLVWPERFTFPVHRGDRVGRAKLGAGLLLYTLVAAPRSLGLPHLPGAATVRRRVPGIRAAGLKGGGDYLDGATDDARLALAVVASAIEAGALALSRIEVRAVEAGTSGARIEAVDLLGGGTLSLDCSAVVLAGGPFTDELRGRAGLGGRWVAPTRGTHLTVPRERLPTDGAVIFASPVDGRVMFLIPWPRYTVVGTTDLDADPAAPVRATRAEVDYLLRSANGLVPAAGLGEDDVVATWAGLRPLLAADEADPSARSREERIERDGRVYTIAGGKLTGYRSMAESLAARLCAEQGLGDGARHSPTRDHRLRGAHARRSERPAWSSLDDAGRPAVGREPILAAWPRRYAALVPAVEEFCSRAEEGRSALDPETLLGEVDWAARFEDCQTAEDFLFRRTDLGLGPRAAAQEAGARVVERLARLRGWDVGRQRAETERLDAALGRVHGWRDEPSSARAEAT